MQQQALKLSRITISNLRSIQRETFPLSDFTALIGYNNAGKTNILMGIRWLLANFSLDISYFDDPNHPVEAEGIFEGITEQVLNRLGEEKAVEIEPFLSNTMLRVKKIQRIPGELPGNIEFWAFCPMNGKRKGGKDWVRVSASTTNSSPRSTACSRNPLPSGTLKGTKLIQSFCTKFSSLWNAGLAAN